MKSFKNYLIDLHILMLLKIISNHIMNSIKRIYQIEKYI